MTLKTFYAGCATMLIAFFSTCSLAQENDETVTPFEIRIDDAVLEDLQTRLGLARFPDQIEGAGWDYGTELGYLKELVAYWRDEYDWRAEEAKLNAFDHFKTNIDGLDIHFIHQRSKEPNAMPIVITHGWPGSIAEFSKIIGPLTDPVAHGGKAEDAFHVVCPSMPGYGFSEIPSKRGVDSRKVAEINATLMARLGYDRYGAQGGDWGSAVTSWLASIDTEHVAGIHLNLIFAGPPSGGSKGVPEKELKRYRERSAAFAEERGYSEIQGTKPQTIGYGLNDSPTGLAAWIVEKFRTWSDCDGDVETQFTKDELLTNIMIYWCTETATSAGRLYYEQRHVKTGAFSTRTETPVGCAIFPKELSIPPRKWAEGRFNVTHWTEMPSGGHFAAMEEPELLVEDLRKFFGTLR